MGGSRREPRRSRTARLTSKSCGAWISDESLSFVMFVAWCCVSTLTDLSPDWPLFVLLAHILSKPISLNLRSLRSQGGASFCLPRSFVSDSLPRRVGYGIEI